MSEFTHCCELEDFKKRGKSQGAVGPLVSSGVEGGLVGGLVGGAIGGSLALATSGALLPLALFGALWGFSFGFVDGFCDQWLNWRLICVGRERCAGGRVAWIEDVPTKFSHGLVDGPFEWLFDNDLSFNLRLSPYNGIEEGPDGPVFEFPRDGGHDYPLASISADKFKSTELLREPRTAAGTPWGLSYEGYDGGKKPDNPGGRWTQHCEIEGDGMHTLCGIAKGLAAIYPVGVAVSVVVNAVGGAIIGAAKGWESVWSSCRDACGVPILCDIGCFLAALVAAIAGAVVGLVAGVLAGLIPGFGQVMAGALLSIPLRHDGDFSDVANDPASGRIHEDDPVFVSGDHVYDAGHEEGWTEIHPVRHLQKVVDDQLPDKPTSAPDFDDAAYVAQVDAFWEKWCRRVKEGRDPEVITKQRNPINIWCTHPGLDGCRPEDSPGEKGPVIH